MRRTLCLTALLAGALPATAQATTLTNSNGTLTLVADQRVSVNFAASQFSGRVIAFVDPSPADAPGCSPYPFNCDGVTRIEATGSAGDDSLTSGVPIPAHLVGGAGNDFFSAYNAPDVLEGGPGNDLFYALSGVARVSGGDGVDSALYSQFGADPVTVTLDGRADDGTPGQDMNVEPDVENFELVTFGAGSGGILTGSGAANALTGSARNDVISGRGGNDRLIGHDGDDTLLGNDGDDTIVADDGFADHIECGEGDDAAVVDKSDQVASDCEHVTTSAVNNPAGDHAPALTWAALRRPLPANATTTLRVDASDDHAVASVKFLGPDGRVLCLDSTAPYTCAYRPLGRDVGRGTLVAIVTDSLGQTASAPQTVTVARFKASRLSLQLTRGGVAAGKLTVSSRATCSGSVRVTAGSVKRTARLSRGCRYSVRLPIRRGRVVATFTGTKQIAPRRSSAREF